MRICFIGHAFHRKTRSSAFFVDLLSQIGEVAEFYSSPDGGPLDDDDLIRTLVNARFDRYVFWQTEYLAEKLLPIDLGPTFIVPMFDAAEGRSDDFWRQFVRCHFISFCRAHHETLQALDCKTSYFQYYPDPGEARSRVIDMDALDAFFWERRPAGSLNMPSVLQQCQVLGVKHLHVHAAADFDSEGLVQRTRLRDRVVEGMKVTWSNWIEDRAEYERVAGAPLFHFAPREVEGIGMANLEAMIRGQIVVAPDWPTANEYIAHRTSGLLYDPASGDLNEFFGGLTRKDIAMMSDAARSKVVHGRRAWLKDVGRLKSILSNDGQRWTTSDYSSHFGNAIRSAAHEKARRAL